MHVLPIVLGILLGTYAPVAIGSVTALQWAQIALTVIQDTPKAIKYAREIDMILNSPEFRAWAAANGETAIRLRPGEITER